MRATGVSHPLNGRAKTQSRGPSRWAAPKRGPLGRGDTTRLRVLWLLASALLLASAIWVRLAYWQVGQHALLSDQAAQYHLRQVALPAARGAIYDRDMNLLAVDTTVYDVTLSPTVVKPASRAKVADGLSTVLGMQTQDVMDLLESSQAFAYVKKRQPKEIADRIASLELPGVGLDPQPDRRYLQGGTPDVTLASSLLGFVNYAGKGQQGVEQRYNARLGGQTGSAMVYHDPTGREITLSKQKLREPVDGVNLVLTLDSSIQYAAEQAIAEGVKNNKAQSGSVLVMDSRTGEIAAWANYPAYDANAFTTTDPARMKDPIVSDHYEPGSVMKVVTLAGAIDQGKITPSTTIQDPGFIVVGGNVLHDWNGINNGTVTMTNVLEKSLNVGAVRAEQAEGPDAFLHYLDAFGIAKKSGVDVAGEVPPTLQPQWRATELATASFGQGVAVNMVQMCAAINVIANGGRWVQPHVVKQVGNVRPSLPAARQAVSPQAAAAMTQMMESVVQHGSGHMARVQGFEQNEAGKTGTSEMPENGRYSHDHVWASYAGFLPADNPRFTMLVVVRQPDNGSFDHNEGYYVSGPIWKRIAEQIIERRRITPGPVFPSN
jgi:cell division protein FtsI/penicillin-binding protein 2